MQISANLHTFPFPGMGFTLKICQTVACISMMRQFHEFFELNFGGFLKFGSTVH